MSQMPVVHLEKLSGEPLHYAEKITFKGSLRASKPKMQFTLVPHPWGGQMREYDLDDATAAFIWRMVAFFTSPKPEHQCMPVTAELDIPIEGFDELNKYIASLEPIIDAIVDAIDMKDWHGIIRWGQAFGRIGTPQYNEEGAVIYR